jgi:hypothetical protein
VSSAPPGDRPDAELGVSPGNGAATGSPCTALGSPVPAVTSSLSDPGRRGCSGFQSMSQMGLTSCTVWATHATGGLAHFGIENQEK